MNREEVLNMLDGGHLAHYGIKGQKWGDRRFQNEDGSLTPEGRRRYGLKSDYSNMSDKELQEAISTKRTQNQYVDLMTEGPRKKKQEISNFIKTASSTAKSANDLADKTVYEKARSGFKEEQDYFKSRNDEIKDELKDARKANDTAKIESLEAEQAQNKEKIDFYKDAQKSTDAFKGAVDTVSGLPAQYSEGIGKIATKDELEERTAVAYRNINEMDKDQLKKTVDRMMLEKQYDELVNPPQPSRWERGREVLQTIGSILAIAGTAAGLVLTIKKIKGSSAAQSDEDGEYLAHYGVKGMKKGDRRYQNEDGSLTPEGYRHYGIDPNYKRGISDQKDVLARKRNQQQRNLVDQRNRQQLNARNTAYQERQRAYTQKLARRQAIRDAKNQAAIDSIARRQAARDERYRAQLEREDKARNLKIENEAKAENRKNLRKNVVKGVAAVAAIGAALYVGRHILREKAFDNAHVRDMDKINAIHRNDMQRIKFQAGETRWLKNKDYTKDMYVAKTDRIKEANKHLENKYINKTNRIGQQQKYKLESTKEANVLSKLTADYKGKLDLQESQIRGDIEKGKQLVELKNIERDITIDTNHTNMRQTYDRELSNRVKYGNDGKLKFEEGRKSVLDEIEKKKQNAAEKRKEAKKIDPEVKSILGMFKKDQMDDSKYINIVNPDGLSGRMYKREGIEQAIVDLGYGKNTKPQDLNEGQLKKLLEYLKEHAKHDDEDGEYLAHYGVKGMKKGVRRWTNEDGTLTEEGKRHYGIGLSENKVYRKTPEPKAPIKSKVLKIDYNNKSKEYIDRMNKAADLGLSVLSDHKFMQGNQLDKNDLDKNKDDYREWFNYEDQTFGMPIIADLVLSGYSPKDINAYIDEVEKNYDYDNSTEEEFMIVNGNYENMLKKFAQECYNKMWENSDKKRNEQYEKLKNDPNSPLYKKKK